MSAEEGVETVIQMMKDLKNNIKFDIEFVDVFCEKGFQILFNKKC